MVAKGESSTFWGKFVIISVVIFLSYAAIATLVTVKYHDIYGCFKVSAIFCSLLTICIFVNNEKHTSQVLGGGGCSSEESSISAIILVSSVLIYCYGTNFYLSYLPILRGEQRFSWKIFV